MSAAKAQAAMGHVLVLGLLFCATLAAAASGTKASGMASPQIPTLSTNAPSKDNNAMQEELERRLQNMSRPTREAQRGSGSINMFFQPYTVYLYAPADSQTPLGQGSGIFPTDGTGILWPGFPLPTTASEYVRVANSLSDNSLVWVTQSWDPPVDPEVGDTYRSVRLEIVSPAFLRAGYLLGPLSPFSFGDGAINSTTLTLKGDTLTYTRSESYTNYGYDYYTAKYALLECEPNSGPCCDSNGKLRSSTTECRAADGCKAAAFCSGEAAECPASDNLAPGSYCPWRPAHKCKSSSSYGYTHDANKVQPQVPAKPAYDSPYAGGAWPECGGKCFNGACVLRDHPECCYPRPEGQAGPSYGRYTPKYSSGDRDYNGHGKYDRPAYENNDGEYSGHGKYDRPSYDNSDSYGDDHDQHYAHSAADASSDTAASTSGFWHTDELFCWDK